jgi:tol-pal system protein YbgF
MCHSRGIRAVVFVAASACLLGCVMPDEIARLQKDVADLRQELRQVEADQAELEQRVEEPRHPAGPTGEAVTREEMADVQLRLEQLSRQVAVGTERTTEVAQRLDFLSQDLQRAREALPVAASAPPDADTDAATDETVEGSEPVSSPPAAPEAFPDPEALYNTAYADFSKGNYALAVSGFREYQERFPESALADNALYWIAECRFSQGDYAGAVNVLDDLLGRYPDSDKAAAANLKKALAFQEQNQIGQAIIQYRYVARAFPDTDEARLARDKLGGLGASLD